MQPCHHNAEVALYIKPPDSVCSAIQLYRRKVFSITGDPSARFFPDWPLIGYMPRQPLHEMRLEVTEPLRIRGTLMEGDCLYLQCVYPQPVLELLRTLHVDHGVHDRPSSPRKDWPVGIGVFVARLDSNAVDSVRAIEPPMLDFYSSSIEMVKFNAHSDLYGGSSWRLRTMPRITTVRRR
jgi:hypothetical protein